MRTDPCVALPIKRSGLQIRCFLALSGYLGGGWRCGGGGSAALEAPALGHGVEFVIDFFSVKPPWWRNFGGESATAFFFKCSCFQILCITPLLLAGLGGEGEKKRGAGLWERSGYPKLLLGVRSIFCSRAPAGRGGEGSWWCWRVSPFWCWWFWASSPAASRLRPAMVAWGVALGEDGSWRLVWALLPSAGRRVVRWRWCRDRVRSSSQVVVAQRRPGFAVIFNMRRCFLYGGAWYGDGGVG